MTYVLRPYQTEAVDALHKYICEKKTNPCIVLPTGSGKSIVMADTIRKWHTQSPWVRGCVLAHRKELVVQNAEKLHIAYPDGDIGIFSAGLGKRDYDSQILFASIDSIYKRSGEFQPFDFLFVDEAHRIPPAGEGKYRTFIKGCQRFNKELRTIGWTATAYRMGCGEICHKNHILNEVCYKAEVTDLISQGYLCNLRSKVGSVQPKLQDVRRNSGGDYVLKSLAAATNRQAIVSAAIAEAAQIIKAESRRSVIFFCVDIEHCHLVSKELRKHDIHAPFLTSKIRREDRDRLIRDFRDRRIHAVCNVGILTEGFDVSHIDCIVLLRPTLSPGLYYQMVGRGLRPDGYKSDCLVLDYGLCIDTHGPIDLLGGQLTVMAICKECRESFSRVIRVCPRCGWVVPKLEMEKMEQVERERRMHGKEASGRSILSDVSETLKVDAVFVARHVKPGKPHSMRVQYRCGLSIFREWICFDHEGFAGQKAQAWWHKRFGGKEFVSVNDALGNLFTGQGILEWTKTITVRRNGKHYEVIDYNKSLEEMK